MVELVDSERRDVLQEDCVDAGDLLRLQAQIEGILTDHREALQAEEVLQDVERVLRWVERCQEGSARAERKLYQEGMELLEGVCARLKLGMEEQQRIMEESPSVAAHARGRTAERYAKASSRASGALDALSNLTHPPLTSNQ